MGKVLILLAVGLAAADKLDRFYLPPPGAKFSGGSPDDLQTPFELPKNTFDDTSSITVQDKEVLRSGFVDGITIGPNIGPIVGTTSDSMNSQTLYTVSSPVTLYTYYPSTVFQESDYGTTISPLDTNQGINSLSSIDVPSLQNSVPNIKFTGQIPSIYQDVASTYQYPSLNVPYFDDIPIKTVAPSNTRQYLKQDKEKPVFSVQKSNTQNPGTIEGSAAIYQTNEREITDSLIEMIQYPGKNIMPINNYQSKDSVETIQNVPNAAVMDDFVNAYRNPENLQFNSTIPNSNIKSILGSPGAIALSSSAKSEPFSPTNNITIASDLIKLRPERPQAEADRNAVVLNYQSVITPEEYLYAYDTSNGISAKESGTANDGVRAQGAYSYTGDDGKVYRVVYTADENGFLPHGDHLPRVPEPIQQLIEKAAREKEAGVVDDGSYDEAKYGHKNYEGVMERYNPEYQGFTNTMDQYKDVLRKQNTGKGMRKLLKIIPGSIQHEDNDYDNNYGPYRPSGNLQQQGDGRGIQFNLESEIDKQLGNTFSQMSLKEFFGDGIDNKELDVLFKDDLNINSLGNQGVTKIQDPDILINQGEDLQKGAIDFGVPSEYSPKQNIPGTVQNLNPVYNNLNGLVDKQDGYSYITPQNKFIENKIRFKNKGSNPFNIDQELDIGDDDIISISVPSPNTYTSPENEIFQTDSLYKKPYTIGKISFTESNEDQGVNESENTNVPAGNIDSKTVPIDDSIQPKQLSDPTSKIEYGVPINPAAVKQTQTINIISRAPTFQQYGTPSMVDGFGKPITAVSYKYQQNLSMIPKFYGQNPNMRLSDFDVGNNDISNLKKGDESELSHERDFQNDYFESLKSISDQYPDSTLGTTAKTVIGEDFSGPKRPQTFDPQTGYFY